MRAQLPKSSAGVTEKNKEVGYVISDCGSEGFEADVDGWSDDGAVGLLLRGQDGGGADPIYLRDA
jgi:hypothetical protein